ncbi:MAG: segregation/condensation protein A [Rhodospirillaceae bacterium]|jgi:segregation and condensation protein A|nr:segregation/condensation protein A [Rhodospirillaceae bacterium]
MASDPPVQDFNEDEPRPARDSRFVVDLDGFEGPLDLLLELARHQKVDLIHISILQLADQYLAFVAEARKVRLEVAADYLVMAAWLAYLKSRLLLPRTDDDEGPEPTGEEMAAALQFQLRRLEAMREAGERLLARPRLGVDIFGRGEPEGITVISTPDYDLSLYELLSGYARQKRRGKAETYSLPPLNLYSVEDAIERLTEMLGRLPDWRTLASFLPAELGDGLERRSAVAAHFSASLEMARTGRIELRQGGAYAPIYLRRKGGPA